MSQNRLLQSRRLRLLQTWHDDSEHVAVRSSDAERARSAGQRADICIQLQIKEVSFFIQPHLEREVGWQILSCAFQGGGKSGTTIKHHTTQLWYKESAAQIPGHTKTAWNAA